MARITVEDCIQNIPNRFDLVLLAAQRSRDITNGAEIRLDDANVKKDKNSVIALREIAEDLLDQDSLREAIVQRMQRVHRREEPDEDELLTMLQKRARGTEETAETAIVEEPVVNPVQNVLKSGRSLKRDNEDPADALFAKYASQFENVELDENTG